MLKLRPALSGNQTRRAWPAAAPRGFGAGANRPPSQGPGAQGGSGYTLNTPTVVRISIQSDYRTGAVKHAASAVHNMILDRNSDESVPKIDQMDCDSIFSIKF